MLIASYLLVDTIDPDGAGNVNKLFGPKDDGVQTWMPRIAWLGVLMAAYPLLIYGPSHFLFRRMFPAPEARTQAAALSSLGAEACVGD